MGYGLYGLGFRAYGFYHCRPCAKPKLTSASPQTMKHLYVGAWMLGTETLESTVYFFIR